MESWAVSEVELCTRVYSLCHSSARAVRTRIKLRVRRISSASFQILWDGPNLCKTGGTTRTSAGRPVLSKDLPVRKRDVVSHRPNPVTVKWQQSRIDVPLHVCAVENENFKQHSGTPTNHNLCGRDRITRKEEEEEKESDGSGSQVC